MRRSALFLLLLAQGAVLWAQRPAFGPAPAWVEPLSEEGAHISDRNAIQQGTEYRLLDQQFHLGRREYYTHSRTVLLDPTGVQNNSRISIDFDPSYQQITIHQVRIVRGDRVIEKYDASKVEVIQREESMDAFLYDGTRTVVIELDDVRPGDIVEQAWTVRGWSPSFGDRFQTYVIWNYSVPVARQRVRFVVPPGRPTRFFSHVGAPTLHRTERKGNAEYELIGTDLPAVVGEDEVPEDVERFAFIDATEFADWDEVRVWATGLFNTQREVPEPLRARVVEWNTLPDAYTRMDSAWALVRDEVRYLGLEQGLSAYKPHAPDKVYAQRFGDCKDMSLLLSCLLNAVGIEAWPALVDTYGGTLLDKRTPRGDAFDHCIVQTRLAGETFWLDPTDSYARGTVRVHHMADHGWALVLDAGRKGLDRMPPEVPGLVRTVQAFDVKKVDGEALLSVESIYEGECADNMRGRLAVKGPTEVSSDYVRYYNAQFGEVATTAALEFEDDVVRNHLEVREHYRLTDPWKSQDEDSASANIKLTVDPGTVKDYLQLPRYGVRKAPLALVGPVRVEERFELDLPEDWPTASEADSASGSGVSFSYVTRTDKRRAEVEYHYTTSGGRVEPDDYPAFEQQQSRIQDDLGRSFLWNGAVAEAPRSFRPHELMHWLLFLAIAIWICRRIWSWDPEPLSHQYPGDGIGGWLVLPSIGLCVAPIVVLVEIWQNDFGIIFLTDSLPALAVERPVLAHLFVYISQLCTAFQLVYYPLLIVLFFKRRSSARTLMIFTYAFNVVYLVFDGSMYHLLGMEAWAGPYTYEDIGRAVFAGCIWVPYFAVSERVKRTFVKRLRPLPVPPPLPMDIGQPPAPPDAFVPLDVAPPLADQP